MAGTLTQLAERLLADAKRVDAYLESQRLPPANFHEYNLDHVPREIVDARNNIVNDASKLRSLVELPEDTSVHIAASWADILTLRFLYRYSIAQYVPLKGSASYSAIAEQVGLSESLVFRFIRHAMILHFFDEPASGQVCHTFLSRRLATDHGFCDGIGLHAEDFTDASIKFIEALETYGESGEPSETAFSLAHSSHGKKQSIFEWFGQHPDKAKRFGGAMKLYTTGDTWSLDHLYNAFEWQKWDTPDTVMVDVAGGFGHVTQYLASRTGQMQYIVQDLPHVTDIAGDSIPAELKGRVSFMPQNFLEPMALSKPADIIFMRWILHNWSDKYAVQIMRNLIPALRPGSKVLIYEFVMDDAPIKEQTSKMSQLADIIMEVGFAGKERTAAQYRELIRLADERFYFEGVRKMSNSSLSLVEVTWLGDVKPPPPTLFHSVMEEVNTARRRHSIAAHPSYKSIWREEEIRSSWDDMHNLVEGLGYAYLGGGTEPSPTTNNNTTATTCSGNIGDATQLGGDGNARRTSRGVGVARLQQQLDSIVVTP